MASLFSLPKTLALDSSADPQAGATLYFYVTASTTPLAVYADASLNTSLGSSVTADAYGVFPAIFLQDAAYRVTLLDAAGVTQWTVDGVGGYLTATSVGTALWPVSSAETSAGLSASDLAMNYDYGDVRRYGAVGDGSTDDTAALTAAIKASHYDGVVGVELHGLTCATSGISVDTYVPTHINGGGGTLKAVAASSTPVLTIANPHSTRAGFYVTDVTVDGVDLAPTVYLHGAQYLSFVRVRALRSTTYGMHLKGESGYGIYYCSFTDCQAGANGLENADSGWMLDGTGASYYIASNSFLNCRAQFNQEHGWEMDYANNTFVGCEAEKNDLYGWYVNRAYSVDIVGGYSENNHRNYATDGVTDGTTDYSFYLEGGGATTGVVVHGGRHIGQAAGDWSGVGCQFAPNYSGITYSPSLDPKGTYSVRRLKVSATSKTISAATRANPCAITTSTAHGWETGDIVYLSGFTDTGWTALNTTSYAVTVTSTTEFTIAADTSGYGAAYTAGGTAQYGGGLGLAGATPSYNAINGADGMILQAAGTTALKIYSSGCVALVDGITAPAEAAGYAKLYVDASDGDLKVIFGDGTIKTIVVDT